MTCETCPHYLFLTPDDVERLGAVAKCAPPVREQHPVCGSGSDEIHMVTSDHSPSSPDLKQGAFGDAWGGIAGCQTTLMLLAGECEPPSARAAHLHRRRGALRHAAARAGSSRAPTPTSRWST